MSSHAQCFNAGLRICRDCRRNVDNNPVEYPERTIKPAADPPRCADWKAIPMRAIDASHGRL